MSLFKKVDAVVIRVPSVEQGLSFYRDKLNLELLWQREDAATVKLGDSELVLSTVIDPETDLLVGSVDDAVANIKREGGSVLVEPEDLDVGKVAVVQDPFGNKLTLVDLSKGLYQTDKSGSVTGVE